MRGGKKLGIALRLARIVEGIIRRLNTAHALADFYPLNIVYPRTLRRALPSIR